jgi:hypothetical protein
MTVCGEATVEMLKFATSLAPGPAAGSGVAALLEVDQKLAVLNPLFELLPVPSHHRSAPNTVGAHAIAAKHHALHVKTSFVIVPS